MWTSPIILSIIILFCLLSLGTEIRHMKRSLESCSTAVASSWDDLPETVTVTTTYIPPSQSKWWFAETAPELPTSTTPVVISSSYGMDITSTRSSPPVHTRCDPKPAMAVAQETALLAIHSLPFPWPFRFNFNFDLPPAARTTVDKVLRGLELVWKVFRKVYHYPLDPPG
jgi:hypothetical protein